MSSRLSSRLELRFWQMWCYERKLELPRQVIEMIAERSPNNVRELEGVFNQIVAQTRFGGMPLTLPQAEDTLERYTRPREHITIIQVMRLTADYHGLQVDDFNWQAPYRAHQSGASSWDVSGT